MQFLARPDSNTVGILGCGLQGRTNLMVLMELLPIERVHAYDIDKDSQANYVTEVQEKFSIDVIGVAEPRQAVEDLDLIFIGTFYSLLCLRLGPLNNGL